MVRGIQISVPFNGITKTFLEGLWKISALSARERGLVPPLKEDIILDLSRSTGAALMYRGRLQILGSTPKGSEIRSLAEWLRRSHMDPIFYTTQLSRYYSGSRRFADKVTGLLAICIDHARSEYLMIFKSPLVPVVEECGRMATGRPDESDSGIAKDDPDHLISAPWTDKELTVAERLRREFHVARRRIGELVEVSDQCPTQVIVFRRR